MNRIYTLSFFTLLYLLTSCSTSKSAVQQTVNEDIIPHIVFVIGDEEYRSEESMPMMAELLKKHIPCKISLCYSVDSLGFIDPNNVYHIEGLEALKTADAMVMFTRFRALPNDQMKLIKDFSFSGKPMVGFRTSTHAFMYKDDKTKSHMNDEWPTRVFGQQWITHHGHFDDGANPLTQVRIMPSKTHKILSGFEGFKAYSWLYHVDGGNWNLYGDSKPFLEGTSLKSGHEMKGRLDQFPLSNPVAWTKTFHDSRVFFTTLGHPYDFKNENMRRLALQGILWALGKENMIPNEGLNVDYVTPYNPNNSGFGTKFKPQLRPKILD